MAKLIEDDGTEHDVPEPRVAKMMLGLVRHQGEVARIEQGCVRLDFGSPGRRVQIEITHSVRVR